MLLIEYSSFCLLQKKTLPTKTSINQDLGQSQSRKTDTLSNDATSYFYELRFDEYVLTNY